MTSYMTKHFFFVLGTAVHSTWKCTKYVLSANSSESLFYEKLCYKVT